MGKISRAVSAQGLQRLGDDDGSPAPPLHTSVTSGAFMRLAFRAAAMPEQLGGVAPMELNAHPH